MHPNLVQTVLSSAVRWKLQHVSRLIWMHNVEYYALLGFLNLRHFQTGSGSLAKIDVEYCRSVNRGLTSCNLLHGIQQLRNFNCRDATCTNAMEIFAHAQKSRCFVHNSVGLATAAMKLYTNLNIKRL